jgi:hypothetical protein
MPSNLIVVFSVLFLVLSLVISTLSLLIHRITTPPSSNQSSRSAVELVDSKNNKTVETLIVPGKYLVYSGDITGDRLERHGSFSSYTFVRVNRELDQPFFALRGAPQDRAVLSASVTAYSLAKDVGESLPFSKTDQNTTSAIELASRFSLDLGPILRSTTAPVALAIDATIYSHM